MNSCKKINHYDIAEAVRMFKEQGGTIHQLPEQKACDGQIIGDGKHNPYEHISELVTL